MTESVRTNVMGESSLRVRRLDAALLLRVRPRDGRAASSRSTQIKSAVLDELVKRLVGFLIDKRTR